MEADASVRDDNSACREGEGKYVLRYALLTVGVFGPLALAFIFLKSTYPVAAWSVMLPIDETRPERFYYILRGETVSGETVDVAPAKLTNTFYSRAWWIVEATVHNRSFRFKSPHPENVRLLAMAGDQGLPRAARLPELLRAFATIYNERLPANSPQRLKAIRLDVYSWDATRFADYERFVESWRVEP